MRSMSKLMGEGVRQQGGIVQNFTGDGIMAVFGAPVAFEDAPLRACRAALAILQRLKEAGPELEAKHGVRPEGGAVAADHAVRRDATSGASERQRRAVLIAAGSSQDLACC